MNRDAEDRMFHTIPDSAESSTDPAAQAASEPAAGSSAHTR
jgi:hypothetical protein